MPSIVWGRDPQEAYDNPYEYGAQEQFQREVDVLLAALATELNKSTLRFHRDDESLDKATWMLSHDLVDALVEIGHLIVEKRHRVAGRLFRDCVETMDFLQVLHSRNDRAKAALVSWYQNRTFPHSEARKLIESSVGKEAAQRRRAIYEQLSKFTHRTYRALNASYSLGRDDLLVHDSYSKTKLLVLPQVLSSYLAVQADLTVQATEVLESVGALPADTIRAAWATALETHTVPRRFAMR